jgi:hypothetical protein
MGRATLPGVGGSDLAHSEIFMKAEKHFRPDLAHKSYIYSDLLI